MQADIRRSFPLPKGYVRVCPVLIAGCCSSHNVPVTRDTRAYYEHEASSVKVSHPPHSSPQYSKPLPSSILSGMYLSNGVEDCHSRNTWRKGSTIAASQPKQGCREMDSVLKRKKGMRRAGAYNNAYRTQEQADIKRSCPFARKDMSASAQCP